MHTKLKLQLEEAINNVIQRNCEDDLWEELITDDIHIDMANAAAIVFDASMKGQIYAQEENGI